MNKFLKEFTELCEKHKIKIERIEVSRYFPQISYITINQEKNDETPR